jgi:hypothetical protein
MVYYVEKWDLRGVWTGLMWFRTEANGGLFYTIMNLWVL